jgi:low density lipoprotein receptor-related protein 5/6
MTRSSHKAAWFRPSVEVLEDRNLLSTHAIDPPAGPGSADLMYWIDQSSNDIRRANLDGTGQQTVVAGLGSPIFIALDVAAGQMYWTDQVTNDIRRANLDGTGQQSLVSGRPSGIALDVAAGKMYWTDFPDHDVRRANLDGTAEEVLVSDQPRPSGIALDVAAGKMYWTNPYTSNDIRRANLDGTGEEILVTGLNGPFSITLDVSGGKMYWADDFGGDIRRANLDGTGQQTLVTRLARPVGLALDVAGNAMYWTEFAGGDIRRATLDGADQRTLVTGLPFQGPVGIALRLEAAPPTATCSVADSLLWPPNHRLVNVGLSVTVDPPDADPHVLVYANDDASPADAADIGPDTLRLRSERQGRGEGRVYLIVTTATDSGGTGFDVCTVAVPHDPSPCSVASAQQQAAAAEAYYREFQAAPPGYHLLGEGPDGGRAAPSSGRSGRSALDGDVSRLDPPASATPLASWNRESGSGLAEAPVPPEHSRSAWTSVPADGYFATAHEEGFRLTPPRLEPAGWEEGNGLGLDLVTEDR